MATIEREAIRATIRIGTLEISTPDVVSFNVRKARGQMASTFSASVRMNAVSMSNNATGLTTEGIIIKAGISGRERQIFKGVIQKVTVNPIRTDASKVMVSLSGKDLMSRMEGQKINRRVKTYRDGTIPPERWGVVTAIEEDNTPVKTGFGIKTFSKKKSVSFNLGGFALTISPKTFADQSIVKDVIGPDGAIDIEKIESVISGDGGA